MKWTRSDTMFLLLYLASGAFFVWIFVTKTIPSVGWEKVSEDWFVYLMMALGYSAVMFMFWGMAKLAELLFPEGRNDV